MDDMNLDFSGLYNRRHETRYKPKPMTKKPKKKVVKKRKKKKLPKKWDVSTDTYCMYFVYKYHC